jgi:hypothetical protein
MAGKLQMEADKDKNKPRMDPLRQGYGAAGYE